MLILLDSDTLVFQYLDDLKCPVDLSQKVSVVDWLLAHAVRVEYAENGLLFSFSPVKILLHFLISPYFLFFLFVCIPYKGIGMIGGRFLSRRA